MPQLWQKEALYANSRMVVPENAFVSHCDGSMGRVLLSDNDSKPSSSGSRQTSKLSPVFRAAGFLSHWGKRYGSAVLRYKPWRNTKPEQPARSGAVHEKHALRHRSGRRVSATFNRRLAEQNHGLVRPYLQTEYRTAGHLHPSKPASKTRNAVKWRYEGNNIVDRLLNKLSDFTAPSASNFKKTLVGLMLVAMVPLGTANAAASLVIKPTRITITQDAPVVAVTITNQGNTEANIQLQLMAWSQENGEDVYGPSDTLGVIACPSIVNIPAGQSQIVRVGLEEEDRVWDKEGTFRLFIQEIPPEAADGATAVRVAVRIGVPVFLPPAQFIQPALSWQIKSTDQDGLWMTATNEGTSHVLISGIQLRQDDFLFQANTHQYILPGASISWQLDHASPVTSPLPGSVELLASTDQGSYEETLSTGK